MARQKTQKMNTVHSSLQFFLRLFHIIPCVSHFIRANISAFVISQCVLWYKPVWEKKIISKHIITYIPRHKQPQIDMPARIEWERCTAKYVTEGHLRSHPIDEAHVMCETLKRSNLLPPVGWILARHHQISNIRSFSKLIPPLASHNTVKQNKQILNCRYETLDDKYFSDIFGIL